MSPSKKEKSLINPSAPAITFIFFVTAFLYVWFRIDPRLFYFDKPEIFLKTFDFFKNFALIPGGITTYIAKFFFQLNYFPWLGSFIIVALAFLIGINHVFIIKKMTNRNLPLLVLLPLIFTLLVLNQYITIPLTKILVTFIFVTLFVGFSPGRSHLRGLVFLGFSLVLFYLAKEIYWLFVAMCAIFEILKSKKYLLVVFYLLVQVLFLIFDFKYLWYLQYSKVVSPLTNLLVIFSYNNIIELAIVAAVLALVFISLQKTQKSVKLLVALILIISYIQLYFYPPFVKLLYSYFLLIPFIVKPLTDSKVVWLNKKLEILRIPVRISITVLFLILIVLTFNNTTSSFLKLNFYTQNKSWDKVLNTARKIPVKKYDNISISPFIVRALYYTGMLPYELFSFPHLYPPGIRTITPEEDKTIIEQMQNTVNFIEHGQTCFELGLINYAEVMAYYALEYRGDLFPAFQQIALIYILKENDEAARVILNMLKKNLILNNWADKYLKYLDDKSLILKDKYLMSVKARTIKEDGSFLKLMRPDYDYIMERLLLQNINNKMAFEYMMAYFLLTGQTRKIIENLYLLDYYDIVPNPIEIPRSYEEAIVINIMGIKNYNLDTGQRKVAVVTGQKFVQFDKDFKDITSGKLTDYKTFIEKYGNTYFLFYRTHFK